MKKEIIDIADAPKAVGPYSQGVEIELGAAKLTFFSGQIAIDPKQNKLIDGGVEAQTKQILENISALLRSRDMDFQSVVKTCVFLTDMSAFAAVNKIYGEYFTVDPPARSCVEVRKLPLNALVEIEVIALK